jgi:hypothetical protein
MISPQFLTKLVRVSTPSHTVPPSHSSQRGGGGEYGSLHTACSLRGRMCIYHSVQFAAF